MKKLNITKERFEKSRYFTKKYGKLAFVSESGKTYKTEKGHILKFVNEAREYVNDDSIEADTAEEFIIFDDPDIFKKIAEVQQKKGKEVRDEVKDGDVNADQVAQAAQQVQNPGSTAATIAAVGGVASSLVSGAATLANSPLVMGLAAAAGYKSVLNKAGELGEQIGDDFWAGYEELSGRAQQARDMEKKSAELVKREKELHANWVSWANDMISKSNIEKTDTKSHAFNDQVLGKDMTALRMARQLATDGKVAKKITAKGTTYYTPEEVKKWFDDNGYTIDGNGVVNRTDNWIDPKTGKAWKDTAAVAGATAGTTAATTTATSGGWTLFGMSAATIGWIVAGVAAAAVITPYIYDKVRACTKTWLADIIAEVKFKADGKEYRCFYDLDENKWILTYANVKWTSYMDNKLDDETIEEFFNSQFFKKFLDKCKQTFAFLFSTGRNEVVFKTLPEIKDAPKELKDILEKIYDNKGAITKNLFTGNHD